MGARPLSASRVLGLPPTATPDGAAGGGRFELVGASDPFQPGMAGMGTYQVWNRPPSDAPVDGPFRGRRAQTNAWPPGPIPLAHSGDTGSVVPWDVWSKSVTNFEARSGQVNEW